ncbi:MAG TPA: hypothetical protein VFG30_36465 [Polyangiales bacterium]|nr:hypothetical protein [Polyangiales bacterium]
MFEQPLQHALPEDFDLAAVEAPNQHISRRRLDEIFRAELGPEITFPARTCDLKPWRANDVNSIWMVLEFHRE